MSQDNSKTLDTYNKKTQEYIERSPQVIEDGEFEDWVDSGLRGLKKTARIFEIGSASGRDADYMENQGFENVQRTDASSGFVDYMQHKGKEAELFDALNDELPRGVDMVYANAVLVHFTKEECTELIKRIHDALSVGGRFVFSVKQGKGSGWSSTKLDSKRFFSYWGMEELIEVLRSTGFKDIYSEIGDSTRAGQPQWIRLIAFKREDSQF